MSDLNGLMCELEIDRVDGMTVHMKDGSYFTVTSKLLYGPYSPPGVIESVFDDIDEYHTWTVVKMYGEERPRTLMVARNSERLAFEVGL